MISPLIAMYWDEGVLKIHSMFAHGGWTVQCHCSRPDLLSITLPVALRQNQPTCFLFPRAETFSQKTGFWSSDLHLLNASKHMWHSTAFGPTEHSFCSRWESSALTPQNGRLTCQRSSKRHAAAWAWKFTTSFSGQLTSSASCHQS